MLHLGIGSHGCCSMKLFSSHKPSYDSQWPLTGHYYKWWILFKAITAHIQWSYDFGTHVWKKTLLRFLFFTSQWAGKRPKQVTILIKIWWSRVIAVNWRYNYQLAIMVVFCLFFENFIFFRLSGDENDLNLGVYDKLPNQISNKQS